jgi:NADH:ubiquinone oxidoreductase subunit 6 (subunit J)
MADPLFLAISIVTIAGAIMALEAREIVYGAVALAGSFFGVAAIYFLLDSTFVAVFQITVYIGSVAVLILFTVMLVRQEKWLRDAASSLEKLAGILTAGAIAISLIFAFMASNLWKITPSATAPSLLEIGKLISTEFSPALQVLALVLAASVLGAITLAKVEKEEE